MGLLCSAFWLPPTKTSWFMMVKKNWNFNFIPILEGPIMFDGYVFSLFNCSTPKVWWCQAWLSWEGCDQQQESPEFDLQNSLGPADMPEPADVLHGDGVCWLASTCPTGDQRGIGKSQGSERETYRDLYSLDQFIKFVSWVFQQKHIKIRYTDWTHTVYHKVWY